MNTGGVFAAIALTGASLVLASSPVLAKPDNKSGKDKKIPIDLPKELSKKIGSQDLNITTDLLLPAASGKLIFGQGEPSQTNKNDGVQENSVTKSTLPTPKSETTQATSLTAETVTVVREIQAPAQLDAGIIATGTVDPLRLPSSVSALGQTIEPSEISGTIPYGKLALAGLITNADIADSAQINYSKLNLKGFLTASDIAEAAAIPYSKINLAASLKNSDIAPGAAIHHSKLDLTGLTVPASIADGTVTDAKLASAYAQLDSSFARGDKLYSGTFSFDSSYPTGGETVDLTSVFSTAIKAVIITSSKTGDTFEADEALFASRKFNLKAFKGNGMEENNGANLSSITNVRYLAVGQ